MKNSLNKAFTFTLAWVWISITTTVSIVFVIDAKINYKYIEILEHKVKSYETYIHDIIPELYNGYYILWNDPTYKRIYSEDKTKYTTIPKVTFRYIKKTEYDNNFKTWDNGYEQLKQYVDILETEEYIKKLFTEIDGR